MISIQPKIINRALLNPYAVSCILKKQRTVAMLKTKFVCYDIGMCLKDL
jgi:hypothetical protein